MRQRTMYGALPDAVEVIRFGENQATIYLRENITSVPVEEGECWEADEYALALPYNSMLEQTIRESFDEWLAHAKKIDFDMMAAEVRRLRNSLLSESDAQMVMDRLGFEIPDTITTTTLLATVKGVFATIKNACKGDWAVYRQALRDITKQPGFPYDVTFPDKPE